MGIFMDRPTLPSADPSTVWLADLIEATEVVAASAEPCDPAIVKAFSHRLELRADVRPPFDKAFAQLSVGASEGFGYVSPPKELCMRRNWTPSIVPNGRRDQTVYVVLNDFGPLGRAYCEASEDRSDLETAISDLIAGHYDNPVRVISFQR